jgi:glycosyltransferase involved in cell wall biosynthesis
MKIVFTTDTIQRGGKERQMFILCRSLLDRGIMVIIVTKNISSENYLEEYRLNKSLIRVFKGGKWLKELNLFRALVISEKPDIIVSFDFQTAFFSLLLYRKYRFVFINASIQHGIRLFRISHLLRTIICFLSPYIVANSFAGLRANNLKPGKRKLVLYNGIETKFFNKYSKEEIENMRIKLIPDYNNNPGFVYVSVANFVPYKDYFTVLKAFARLKKESVFYFLVLGEGPMKSKIEETIKSSGLEKNVFLIGNTQNVGDYLFVSDFLIHSSRGEGISNAILEGMYAGLPVIATSVGGIPETVFPGSSMLFPYKDDNALFDCLVKARATFSKFDPKSEEYKKHLAKFSVGTMVNRFEEILGSVVEREKDDR